jgi:hypothetical protein
MGEAIIRRNLQHAADDDDAADGVGHTHQGGVQGGGTSQITFQPRKVASTNTVKWEIKDSGA